MIQKPIQKIVNRLLSHHLRQAFIEEGTYTKNVTFSLSDEVIQKVEEISKSNKQLEQNFGISKLPITKSDILTNAIETYYEAYFEGLYELGLKLNSEELIGDIIEVNDNDKTDESPLVANTIIVPAHYGENYERLFFKEQQWYAVKVADWRLKNLRYLGVYVGRPLSKITHYAEIIGFNNWEGDPKKYQFKLGKPIELAQPITISKHSPTGLQRGVYTTLDHLLKSKYIDELKNWWVK